MDWRLYLVGSVISRLVISKQNRQWNIRNNVIYGRNHNHYCNGALETSKYKRLEINAADLFAVYYFNCLVYPSIWRAGEHWIEMDGFLLGNPLLYTIYNHRQSNMEQQLLTR